LALDPSNISYGLFPSIDGIKYNPTFLELSIKNS